MSNPNVGPVGGPEVELEPEDVSQSIKEWEDAIKTVQREKDLAIIESYIAKMHAALTATGTRVSVDKNPLGALTQKGFEKGIDALIGVREAIKSAPLAEVQYEGESEEAGS